MKHFGYKIGVDYAKPTWEKIEFSEIDFEKFHFYPNLKEKIETLIVNAKMLNLKVQYMHSDLFNRDCIEFKSDSLDGNHFYKKINILLNSNRKNLADCIAISGNDIKNEHSNSRKGINRLFDIFNKQLMVLSNGNDNS